MMTTTPVSKSRLQCKNARLKVDDTEPTTPSNNSQQDTEDYSPGYFQFTQESNEEIDVMWDWHSPQSSHRRRRKHKRLVPSVQSPKIPLRRFPSNNNNSQEFEKLKNELKALQAALAVPDDESCLSLSPQQESHYKSEISNEDLDIFNDSMDEQLVLFSQQIEENLEKDQKELNNTEIDNIVNKYKENQNEEKYIETVSGRLELHRTKSFEMSSPDKALAPKSVLDQIERKRLEALAKLEAKRRSQCSPEEIEKKRLQAVAKLESKRVQAMVERNRLEALKKLQATRMKNASQVKDTLSKRL